MLKTPPASAFCRSVGQYVYRRGLAQIRFQSTSGSSTGSSTGSKTPEPASQNTTTINVIRDEYSKSGGDDVVAEQKVASYDSKNVQPQSEMNTAGKGIAVNPLEVSPANLEASVSHIESGGHPEKSAEKTGTSKHVSPRKAKEVDQYEKRGPPPPQRMR